MSGERTIQAAGMGNLAAQSYEAHSHAGQPYDALMLVSFGGPESPDDVLPFLQNVTAGRPVTAARLQEVAAHYQHFGGVSPLNAQNRALISALDTLLQSEGPALPIYWGNRNWHPLLPDTIREMAEAGVRRALAFCTSAFSSYSGCRQYLEDIERARSTVGESAPLVDKLRVFFNHPGFIEAMAERVEAALGEIPRPRQAAARIVYTAHSIPLSMAAAGAYVQQLGEAARLVSQKLGRNEWQLAYQSRSGPPQQPWLEPEVRDLVTQLHATWQVRDVVIVPLGFLSDHMEVIYDLDVELREVCDGLGINMVRAGTVGVHPRFVQMIRELILERLISGATRPALGDLPACPDVCPPDCCPRVAPSAP